MNYDEVKTKTLNWCKKLYNNGTYNLQNYNECISAFSQDSDGEIADGLEMPRTGIEHAYGLYDRTANYIENSNPSHVAAFLYPIFLNCPFLKKDLALSGTYSISKCSNLYRSLLKNSLNLSSNSFT